MTKKRRNYSKQFKVEAVKLVTEQGYKISEAARNLGIIPNVLRRWNRIFQMKPLTQKSGAARATTALIKNDKH